VLQAEVSGTVVSVLVENGQPVAPGQTLLIIKQD
jgi:biotin carboxyl carrier protein